MVVHGMIRVCLDDESSRRTSDDAKVPHARLSRNRLDKREQHMRINEKQLPSFRKRNHRRQANNEGSSIVEPVLPFVLYRSNRRKHPTLAKDVNSYSLAQNADFHGVGCGWFRKAHRLLSTEFLGTLPVLLHTSSTQGPPRSGSALT